MEEYNPIIEYFSNLNTVEQIVWGATGIVSVTTLGFAGMVAKLCYDTRKENRKKACDKSLEPSGLESKIDQNTGKRND